MILTKFGEFRSIPLSDLFYVLIVKSKMSNSQTFLSVDIADKKVLICIGFIQKLPIRRSLHVETGVKSPTLKTVTHNRRLAKLDERRGRSPELRVLTKMKTIGHVIRI